MTPQGYAPYASSAEQDAVLDAILSRPRPGDQVVLDLDGCLFDNRWRQVQIIHEYAGVRGCPELYAVQAEHFADWHLDRTLAKAGLGADRVAALHADLRRFWAERFFSGEYVCLDRPMPGAVRLVRQLADAGVGIVYLTGRDHRMHQGSVLSLRRAGFPTPSSRATLLTKPTEGLTDEEWKAVALERIKRFGRAVVSIDNEPSNVNRFHRELPDALVVFVATDHSPLPVEPHPDLPVIRGFLRTDDTVPGIERR